MALIPINNAPIKFGSNFNAIDKDCNCVTHPFLQHQYATDDVEFMHKKELCGSDIITNGNFANGATGWSLSAGLSVLNGAMCSDGTDTSLTQTTLTAAKKYFLRYEIFGRTAGTMQILVDGYDGNIRSANGVFFEFIDNPTGTLMNFIGRLGFDGCIDNIVMYEMDLTIFGGLGAPDLVSNGDFTTDLTGWAVGAGWTQSAGTAAHDGSGGTLEQTLTGSQSGLYYLVSFDITGRTVGDLTVNIQGASYGTDIITTNATHQFIIIQRINDTITNDPELILEFDPNNGFDGAIDNVTVLGYRPDTIETVDIPEAGGGNLGAVTQVMNPQTGMNFQYNSYNNASNVFGVGDCYKIRVTSACDATTMVSEHIKIVSSDCSLKLLTWTNDINAFGFEYKNTGLTHRLRIQSKLRKPSYGGEKEIFIDSQGGGQLVATEKRKQSQLEIFEMPEYLHDALSIMIDHDTITLDGVAMLVQDSDYEPIWRNSSLLAPVAITIEEKTQNLINRNCE